MKKIKEDIKRYGAKSLVLLVCLALAAGLMLVKSLTEVVAAGGWSFLIWLALAIILASTSARYPISFPGTHSSVSISEALTFLAIMLLSPYHGVLLTVVDMALVSRRLKLSPSLYLFNISNHTVSVYVAGQVYYLASLYLNSNNLTTGLSQQLLAFAIPVISLALTHYSLHIVVFALMCYLAFGIKVIDSMRDTLPWEPVTFVAGATVAGLLNYVFLEYGYAAAAVTLVFVLPVPFIIYYTFKTYHDKLGEQKGHYQELANVYDSILEMLAMAIDAKDDATHDHIQRVKLFARRMGELVGLSELEIEALKAGSLLHDIGKIGIPAYILNKPGKLTQHEFEQMKMHTIIGADMLSNIDFRYPVVPVVRHHHERWDGRGYPDGLKGEEIPITARILTLVDNYDALRSDRPYHKAMSREEAMSYIKDQAGTFFDPTLVEKFVSVVDQLEAEAESFKATEKERSRGAGEQGSRGAGEKKSTPAPRHPSTPAQVDRAAAALTSIAETNQRVTALYEMSRTLANLLPVEDIVAILGNRLSKLVPFTTCAISLFDPARSEFEVVHAMGLHSEKFLKRRQPTEVGITGWVITNRRPMMNTNPALDLGFLGPYAASEYKGIMVFPLVKNQEPLGAIALYSTEIETYGAEYIHLMESISQPASDAVYNAKTFDQAQQSGFTDPVTGLATFRTFTAQFERERARSHRLGTPLSLILIHLRAREEKNLYQESLSAEPGEEKKEIFMQALTSLGRLITEHVREIDMAARQADDTIVVMLPGLGQAEASEAQARIGEAINRAGYRGESLSMGAATLPGHGNDLEELLQAARLNSGPDCRPASVEGLQV